MGAKAAPAIFAHVPGNGADYTGRAEIGAGLSSDDFAQVSFAYRPAGTTAWTKIGTDDNAPYRVFHDVSKLAAGTLVEYREVAKDIRGHLSATSTYGIVGTKGTAKDDPGQGTGPVTQPNFASIPGDHNSEMGCPGDWQPDCDQAQLTRSDKDDIWRTSITIPAGNYAYKVAINKSWDENYGAGGALNGGNIGYTNPSSTTPIKFYYDHRTHNIVNSAQGPVIAAVGDFQTEQGCPADWSPDCLRTWLGDPDGDGVYTWTGAGIPAGDFNFKIAYNEGWDVNYGAGGVAGGDNIPFSVPANGLTVQFKFDSNTHVASVAVSQPASSADLTKAKAVWVTPTLLAWPAKSVPAGVNPAELRFRLQGAANGGMTVDSERINSDSIYDLTYDPKGLPAGVVAKYPQLSGYLALKFGDGTNPVVKTLLKGQLAVGEYSDQHKLKDGSGVQIAPVLDALFKGAYARSYGIDWSSASNPRFRLWAPTAQNVTLLTWAPNSADAPADQAKRWPMIRSGDGSWSVAPAVGGGTRYLYEVKVYAPTTGKVETNQVTDPYSVALTLDSDPLGRDQPGQPDAACRAAGPTPPSPRLAKQSVDSTIYELHVRDFSISDTDGPGRAPRHLPGVRPTPAAPAYKHLEGAGRGPA